MTRHRLRNRVKGAWDAGTPRVLAALIAAYVFVWLVGAVAFGRIGVVRFDPAVGLVVPFALVFGPLGVAAAGGAVLLRDVAVGGLGVETPILVAGHLVSGYIAVRFRGLFGETTRRWTGIVRSPRHLASYLGVAVVASSAGAAVVGWGNELLAVAPFFLAAVTAGQYALGTILVGLPALLFFDRVVGRPDVEREAQPPSTVATAAIGVVSVGWLAAGIVGSLGFRNGARLPVEVFEQNGIGFVSPLVDPALFGPGGVRAQAVVGAVAVVLLVVTLWATDDGSGRAAE